jgi:hypothetical protein
MRLCLCSCQPASYLQYLCIAGGEERMHACTAPVCVLVVSVMSLERFRMRATGEAVADAPAFSSPISDFVAFEHNQCRFRSYEQLMLEAHCSTPTLSSIPPCRAHQHVADHRRPLRLFIGKSTGTQRGTSSHTKALYNYTVSPFGDHM